MKIKAVLFDVDGTLVDTLPICLEAFQNTLLKMTGREYPAEEITRHYGVTEEGIMARLLPDQAGEAVDRYVEEYERLHRLIREPFPGIRPLLDGLHARGIPMGVVTGKGWRTARITLRLLGLDGFFSIVETGSPYGKIKPECMLRVVGAFGAAPQEAVYLGDTIYDMESAAAAGLYAAGAAWDSESELGKNDPDPAKRVFNLPGDFASWLNETLECQTVACA